MNINVEAQAHGLGYAMVQDTATSLRFYYSDETPACFAETIVLAPDGSEFLIARTDARGYFSFIPDRAGSWGVEINDGMGHRAMATLTINEAKIATQGALLQGSKDEQHEYTRPAHKNSFQHSKAFMTIFGVSLLANLGLGVTLYRRKKSK